MTKSMLNKRFALSAFAVLGVVAIIVFSFTGNINANSTSKAGEPSVLTINSVKTSTQSGSAVDFTFTYNGKETSFSEFTKGKVVFLNFWGTWCPPCRKEIPDIISIQNDLKDKNFMVIGIAMERDRDPMSKVQSFSKTQGINYINFISTNDLINAYGGVSAVPTTMIIDKDGKIAEKIVGMRTKAQFMASVNKVL